MTRVELREWRQSFGLTQDEVAQMFNVSRNTVQNWESGGTSVPSTLNLACEVWNDRLKKQMAHIGPVTLCYADGPMFVDPYGPRSRPAMLQQEPYPTNAAALARVKILWDRPDFYNPFVIEKSGAPLWNRVELMRVVDGSDKGAPTQRNTIAKLAAYLEANVAHVVRHGAKTASTREIDEDARKVQGIAGELRQLSAAAETRVVDYGEFEALLKRLHALGAYPTNRLVSDVAHAIEGERIARTFTG